MFMSIIQASWLKDKLKRGDPDSDKKAGVTAIFLVLTIVDTIPLEVGFKKKNLGSVTSNQYFKSSSFANLKKLRQAVCETGYGMREAQRKELNLVHLSEQKNPSSCH